MTQAIDIPENIGRNDPCPCGSGKKYKKCHYRAHQLQSSQQKKTTEVQNLITDQTIPWTFFQLLQEIHENNLMSLYGELIHEHGSLKARVGDDQNLILGLDKGEFCFPAGAKFEFSLYRLDAPDTHILLVKGQGDSRTQQLQAQVITLRPNETDADGAPREGVVAGPRIWDVQTFTKDKSELDSKETLTLDMLGYQWNPA